MPDGLYEHDVLAWAEQQAALLRRSATDDAGAPCPLPEACPFALDEVLAGDEAELVARLAEVK